MASFSANSSILNHYFSTVGGMEMQACFGGGALPTLAR